MKKRVSVIVPIYNQEKYLYQSLSSIIKQSYQNLQILLINDGSTDSSLEIIRKFAQKDRRITIIAQPNSGLAAALVAGIEQAAGERIVFVDPDDVVGLDFVQNFMDQWEEEIDALAFGYYTDCQGSYQPYYLKENKIYQAEELTDFIMGPNDLEIDRRIFVSRWNKMYRAAIVKSMLADLKRRTSVSLGEDSVFNALFLAHAQRIKAVAYPNSYFYNIGNNQSMMKRKQTDNIPKIKEASQVLSDIAAHYQSVQGTQALALFYLLISSSIKSLLSASYVQFMRGYKRLKEEQLFANSLRFARKNTQKTSEKVKLSLLLYFPSLLFFCWKLKPFLHYVKRHLLFAKSTVQKFSQNIEQHDLSYSLSAIKHDYRRKTAYKSMRKWLPIIEKRIKPMFIEQQLQGAEKERSEIRQEEYNVFVFWWDGFAKAPKIVQECLRSVEKHYADYRVHQISKYNFADYTDIDPVLFAGLIKGTISIQTFSDILRFNLLKNNGGIWVDATIFFSQPVDLMQQLEGQSFDSLEFSSSSSFLDYKGQTCSWSGFFIASRKNGALVSFVDRVFREYYLRYRNYNTYFFIDIILMLCKVYAIDDHVLDKTSYVHHDMFLLSKSLRQPYNPFVMQEILHIPQKLSWTAENTIENSFYTRLFNESLKGK